MNQIIELLIEIEQDLSVPKNIRSKIRGSIGILESSDLEIAIKVDKILQELEEISNDSNVPSFTRTQIWNVVSLLEGGSLSKKSV